MSDAKFYADPTNSIGYLTRIAFRAFSRALEVRTSPTEQQARVDAGLTDRVVSHTVGDNHNITLVFAVADMAKAKAFMNSKDLKDKMAEAGVDGPPSFFFYRIAAKY